MNLLNISLVFILFKITACGGFACDENACSMRSRRDKISENLIIGMDYLGKPRVVCHCDVKDAWRLTAKYIQASERSHIIKVRGPKLEAQKKDLIYAPSCCKIDLSNPNKLYSYPFTLRLIDQEYNDSLARATTPEYQELKKQLVDGISQLLALEGCVISIEVSKFRQGTQGSVLADMALTIKGLISPCIIDTLKQAVESGNIGGLRVEVFPELFPPNTSTPLPTKTEQSIPPSATSSQSASAGGTPSLTTVPTITAKPTLISATATATATATALPPVPDPSTAPATATALAPYPSSTTALLPAPDTATALPPAPNTAALPPAPDTAPTLPPVPATTTVLLTTTDETTVLPLEPAPALPPVPATTTVLLTTTDATTALPLEPAPALPPAPNTAALPPAPDTAPALPPAPDTATALPPAPNTAVLPPAPDTAPALPPVPATTTVLLTTTDATTALPLEPAPALPSVPNTAALPPAPAPVTASPPIPNSATALPPSPNNAINVPVFADRALTFVIPSSTQISMPASVVVLEQIPSAEPTPALTRTRISGNSTPVPNHTTVSPTKSLPKSASPFVEIAATLSPTPASPVMRPGIPVDYRPTLIYEPNKPGKEYKVAIVLTEKVFDAPLNNPSSSQFLELKELLENSLMKIFRINPDFLSINVVSFRPAAFEQPEQNQNTTNVQMRDEDKLQGIEVTLEIKFREERPGQLTPLETQLRIGTIATHRVSQEMAGVIIKEPDAMRPACPNQCAPSCAPSCSGTCCVLTQKPILKH